MTELETIAAVDRSTLARFDMIIDVRSPGEFAEDHIPGAVNLPVLDNDQRAAVGLVYVRQSRFGAKKMGAAMVARNIALHLEATLADKPGSFQPLIYCWRGGQRSGSMATILSQVGWRTTVLAGGYKTYRRDVQQRLYERDLELKLVLLDGGTGTAKTAILNRLGALGAQILDLERIANHRGSLFGRFEGQAQPSQKWFESRLAVELEAFDSARPVVLEAESSKIGARSLPPALWRAMQTAPIVELTAPRSARARYLVETYDDIINNRPALDWALSRLPVYPGAKRLEAWRELADARAFVELAEAVMTRHYDPAYTRSRRTDERTKLGVVALPGLSLEDQVAAAQAILKLVNASDDGRPCVTPPRLAGAAMER